MTALDMGIPKDLSEPNKLFPMANRFVLVPSKNPEYRYFFTKVSIDFTKKFFVVHMIETAPSLAAQDLALSNGDDFKLTALTGCGGKIYSFDFKEAKVTSHKVDFDYASNDVVTHQIGFEFEQMSRSLSD